MLIHFAKPYWKGRQLTLMRFEGIYAAKSLSTEKMLIMTYLSFVGLRK